MTIVVSAERQSGGAPLISMRGIAELAGVKRPVVTTWRRRHADFPAPVAGDDLAPLFDPRQVAEWLVVTGRITSGKAGEDLSLYTLAGLGAGLPARDLIALVTALICLRHMDDDEPLAGGTDDVPGDLGNRAARLDPHDELVLSEIRHLPENSEWLVTAVDDLVEAAWGCREAFERIMSARSSFKAADLYTSTVAPGLARLVAGISGARERSRRMGSITVTDLNVGAGDLLVAVARFVGEDQLPMFTAAEADPYLARLVRRRLRVHGVAQADMDVRSSNELPDEAGNPDVIVTQLAYAAGEDRSVDQILDLIDDISVRLDHGCRAVVLGPADVLVGELPPYSPAERARAEFLKRGTVEAIIRLPGGLIPFRPGYETAIWTLTSPDDTPWPDRVLLADVSDRELTHDVIDALTDDVITWRRHGYHPSARTREFGTQHRISDLVDQPRSLVARRQPSTLGFQTEATARVTRVAQLEAELDQIGANASARRLPIRSAVASGFQAPPGYATIGSLARARRLVMRQGTRLDPAHLTGDGHHVVLGSPEVLGRSRRGTRRVDRGVLATGYPRARLTEPGDVVVTTVPELGAVVDHLGYALVEYPARVLRIPGAEGEQFTSRVLAALLTTDGAGVRPPGAVRQAQRLEDYRVALLSPVEVRLLDVLLEQLEQRRTLAQQEIDLLSELRDIATSGLIDGTLVLTGNAG
ncbi:MAG TPA: hypothetical protein VMV92_08985 [Streptosporangiaceae bacterium]|nr:hypothetical protein [Streptosporangiaceae bacterium]